MSLSFKITGWKRKPMPPVGTLARNFAHSMRDVIQARIHGQPVMVAETEAERRLAICKQCEKWYDPTRDRCAHPLCGCFMRIKTRLHAMRCPDGKW